MYTLDTNAVIYYLHGEDPARRIILDAADRGLPLYVSVITEAELFAFPQLSLFEERAIETALSSFIIFSADSRTARLAGLLQRHYGLKIGDSFIAATALLTNSTLLTKNTRDFRHVPNLLLEVA
jgi:hypothetical protein